MAPPKELGGSGEGSNPEQLFAVGYAACFHSALLHVAREQGVRTGSSTVTATVGIGPRADQPGFGLTAALSVSLPDVPQDRRRALVEAAHLVCPYSNAVRGNIAVDLAVEDAP
jgi:Ohr subfamily peroxiredoxin